MSIIFRNITKTFGNRTVLENLSLKVSTGEFHVVLGPSGEGKSTLLEIAAGLLEPDTGDIWIAKTCVTTIPAQYRDIGFVFQDYALFPHLTVAENVAYGLRARKLRKSLIKKRVEMYLDLIKLQEFQETSPTELSGGQKQRVALARALATEPEVLLLDEPLSHLDTTLQEELARQIKAIQRKVGLTTLYVTHSRQEAMNLADRVSVLHQGRIVQTETPGTLFYHPKTPFVASFVGVPNILRVQLRKLHDTIATFRVVHPGIQKNVYLDVKRYPIFSQKTLHALCLHPEHIQITEGPGEGNSFPAQILEVNTQGAFTEVSVDVWGLHLKARIPKIASTIPKHGIWISFSPEMLHPICGRSHQQPKHLRQCCS